MATVLALLLFVSFLATFVLGQLDSQMTQEEFQHELQVENQMLELQNAVLAGAPFAANSPITLSSPVTLGSGSVPPFGLPSSGFLQQLSAITGVNAGLGLANITPAPPNWNTGSSCFGNGNGTCSGNNGPFVYWNFSGNHTTVSPKTTGCGSSGCTVVYNVSGNFDQITETMGGGAGDGAQQNIIFVVFGNWDNMTMALSGSCKNYHSATVEIVGTNDTYGLQVNGACTGGAAINTFFVGSKGFICPYGNGVQTDRFVGASWGSSSGVYQNLSWRNAVGYVSGPHQIAVNGGGDFLQFQNTTGFQQCPFTRAVNSGPYDMAFLSGIRAHLNNRYLPPADIAYNLGAVILGVQGGGSVMISPPVFNVMLQPSGLALSLELVNIVGSSATDTGYQTAAVYSQVTSQQSIQLLDGQNNQFLTFVELNITTPYPQAWSTFWGQQASVAPSGSICIPGAGVPANRCLTPPAGLTSTIRVPLFVSELTLTSLVVQVTVL